MVGTLGGGIVGMFVGDWLAGLLNVKETFGYDWIRHGIQVVVGIGVIAVLSLLFARMRAGSSSALPPTGPPPGPPTL